MRGVVVGDDDWEGDEVVEDQGAIFILHPFGYGSCLWSHGVTCEILLRVLTELERHAEGYGLFFLANSEQSDVRNGRVVFHRTKPL
jgi:hypothetical protein